MQFWSAVYDVKQVCIIVFLSKEMESAMMHFVTSLLQTWKLVCENLKVWDLGWFEGLGFHGQGILVRDKG